MEKQPNFEDILFREPKPAGEVAKEAIIPESKEEPEKERINCQHCQDGGPCGFCARGKEEGAKLRKKPAYSFKKPKEKWKY